MSHRINLKIIKDKLQEKDAAVLCNIFYNAAGKGIAMLSFFVLDILIAKLLGYAFYNEWNFAFAIITGFRWIARFGIDSAGKSFVASSKENSTDYIAAAMDLQMIMSVLFVVLTEGILLITYAVFYPFPQYEHLRAILGAGILYAGIYALFSTLKECFVGMVEFKKVFILTALEYMGYLILGVAGMYLWGIYGLITAFVLSLIVAIARGSTLKPRALIHFKERHVLRTEIFHYAKYIAFANVGDVILTEMDSLMLGFMRSNEVGIYAVGKNLIAKATNIPLIICVSCMTSFAVIERGNAVEKERKFRVILKKNAILVGAMCVLFLIFGKFYVDFFYGDQYTNSFFVICILLIYLFLYSLSMYQATFLNYQKQGKWILISQIVLIGTNLILNILFISRYGAIGAAIATGMAMMPSCVIQEIGIRHTFRNCQENSG